MNRFAWAHARTVAEAALAASTTVAHAMTVAPELTDRRATRRSSRQAASICSIW